MADLRENLRRVTSGEPEAVAAFGMERRYSTGKFSAAAGIFEWEQKFLISGQQALARLVLHRSLGDRGGDVAGTFQANIPPDVIPAVANAVLSSGILDYDPGHIEPGDMMTRFRFAALGAMQEVMLSMDQAPKQESIRNFLRALKGLEIPVRAAPLRTVLLECQPTSLAVAGKRMRLPLNLRLANTGSQGHWVLNPAAMMPDGAMERRYVTWARKVEPVPGETPLLPPFAIGVLEPVKAETDPERRLLWLEAGSSIEIPCTAMVNFPSGGEYYFKSAYITFEGGQAHQGQPRWVGGVFSEALVLEAR